MNKFPIDLNGSLDLYLDHYYIQAEFKGQLLKLTFSSFTALRHFILFNQKVKTKKMLSKVIEQRLQHLFIQYYLDKTFVGESHFDASPNWLGSYLGLNNLKLFPKQILKYFFASYAKKTNK